MTENKGYFGNLWNGLSAWLHAADLIPIVIVVSTYHYFGALKTHDPIWVAFPIALFVDLLHYRSVSRAVRSGGAWWLAAALTSSMAFGLQFFFYSSGTDLGLWAWLYASLVPVGLAIMAMLTQANAAEKVRNWAKELADMAAGLAAAQEEARQATAAAQGAAAAKQEAEEAKRAAAAVKQEALSMKQEAAAAKQEALSMKQEAEEAKQEAAAMKQEAELGRLAASFWPHINQRTAAGLRYLAGEFDNMETAAAAGGCHKSTLSKHIATINHNSKEG